MRSLFRVAAFFLWFTLALAASARAQNLVSNGDFSAVTYNGTPPTGVTTLFGQFGPDGTGDPAKKAALTVTSWTTGGYNFVFAPGTADSGTNAGANTGQPNEAPGQFSTNGFGTTYLWGSNNGGLSTIPAVPGGGNFVAADGAYEQGAISQTISGLTLGAIYGVTFSWAAAQQQNFAGDTMEQWKVNLGSAPLTTTSTTYQATPMVSLPSHTASAWMTQTFDFTATSTTETLSFLANGTPNGEPPFSLLGGVSMIMVPEPSSVAMFAGIGAALVGVGIVRRRRRRLAVEGD